MSGNQAAKFIDACKNRNITLAQTLLQSVSPENINQRTGGGSYNDKNKTALDYVKEVIKQYSTWRGSESNKKGLQTQWINLAKKIREKGGQTEWELSNPELRITRNLFKPSRWFKEEKLSDRAEEAKAASFAAYALKGDSVTMREKAEEAAAAEAGNKAYKKAIAAGKDKAAARAAGEAAEEEALADLGRTAKKVGGTRRVKRGRKGTRRQRGGNPKALVCAKLAVCLQKQYEEEANEDEDEEAEAENKSIAAMKVCLKGTLTDAENNLKLCEKAAAEREIQLMKFLKERMHSRRKA